MLKRILALLILCHVGQCKNSEDLHLYVEKPPWEGLAWPKETDVVETLECQGTEFCYKTGESGTYDCNSDADCLHDGAGTWCWEDCTWDTGSLLDGSADCCAYQLGFTDSSRSDTLTAASEGKVASCLRSSGPCRGLCEQLESSSCGVTTEDGFIFCYPKFHPATGSKIYFPTLHLGKDSWLPDPTEVFFKLRPVISFGLQGCDSQKQVEVTVDIHAVMSYVTMRQTGCIHRSSSDLASLNRAVMVDELQEWGWTGHWKMGQNGAKPVGCAIEKNVTRTVTLSDGSGERLLVGCTDLFSSEACGVMHMNDGSLFDTEVANFELKLLWVAEATASGRTVDMSVQVCIEQEEGTCSEQWSSTVEVVKGLGLAQEVCAADDQERDNLCGVDITSSGSGVAPRWLPIIALAALVAALAPRP